MLLTDKTNEAAVKLADFGLSTIVRPDALLNTNCGTLTYVAPEIIQGSGYGMEIDIWSLGIIVYILLCGYPPFHEGDENREVQRSLKGHFEFYSPEWDTISQEAKDLIKKMIVVEPSRRITAKQALEHPWFAKEHQTAHTDISSTVSTNMKVKVFNAKRALKVKYYTLIWN